MKNFYLLVLIALLSSCNSTKRVKQNLLSGNYYEAIQMAVEQLQKGKTNNKTQEQKLLLKEAFKKYKDKKTDQIKFWQKEDDYKNAEHIYTAYLDLKKVQNQIKPFLPMQHPDRNKPLKFDITDYSGKILQSQDQYLNVLYQDAQNLISPNDQLACRDAYSKLEKIQNIDPNYKDVEMLKEDAYQMGLEFVYVKAYNDTNKVIPKPLLSELLDFDTYGLNDFWTVYHRETQDNINYDYDIVIGFQSIIFSPERVIEKERSIQETIEETGYQRDRDGNILRDENGDKLTYTKEMQAEGTLQTIRQVKSVQVTAKVEYFKLPDDQRTATHNMNSDFVFENVYGDFSGDERVLNDQEVDIINNKAVPFPSNEQMLLDAGDDIKNRLKRILKRNKIGLH